MITPAVGRHQQQFGYDVPTSGGLGACVGGIA
jgi:hypothetical protein